MLKKLAPILIFDILVGICFVLSNNWVWNYLNDRLTLNEWGPFQMAIVPQTVVEGKAMTIGTFLPIPNYPFIIFWVALVGNFALIVLVLRNSSRKLLSG